MRLRRRNRVSCTLFRHFFAFGCRWPRILSRIASPLRHSNQDVFLRAFARLDETGATTQRRPPRLEFTHTNTTVFAAADTAVNNSRPHTNQGIPEFPLGHPPIDCRT
jgi:hypothetical protein